MVSLLLSPDCPGQVRTLFLLDFWRFALWLREQAARQDLANVQKCVVVTRYENTEARAAKVAEKGLGYLGMGVSGGEEGARNGAQPHYSGLLTARMWNHSDMCTSTTSCLILKCFWLQR